MSGEIKDRRYCPKVKIGNWNEELFMKEEKIRTFKEKQNCGELLIQKTRRAFENLLKEISIEPPCSYIRFGAIVQIVAPDMQECLGSIGKPLALSVATNENSIHVSQHINEKYEVTVAPSENACVRNSFIITSADQFDRTDEILKYGQDFYIQNVAGEMESLVLFSSPKSAMVCNTHKSPLNFYNHFGEINQGVGLCSQAGNNYCGIMDGDPHVPPSHCRWKALHINPTMRLETEDEYIPSNTRIVIKNSNSNKSLCSEKSWIKTFFGPELGVTCTTYLNVHKVETEQNIWMFVTNKPSTITEPEHE